MSFSTNVCLSLCLAVAGSTFCPLREGIYGIHLASLTTALGHATYFMPKGLKSSTFSSLRISSHIPPNILMAQSLTYYTICWLVYYPTPTATNRFWVIADKLMLTPYMINLLLIFNLFWVWCCSYISIIKKLFRANKYTIYSKYMSVPVLMLLYFSHHWKSKWM